MSYDSQRFEELFKLIQVGITGPLLGVIAFIVFTYQVSLKLKYKYKFKFN